MTAFDKHGNDKELEESVNKQEKLYSHIGELKVENDFLKKIQTTVRDRAEAVESGHKSLSIKKQCELKSISLLL